MFSQFALWVKENQTLEFQTNLFGRNAPNNLKLGAQTETESVPCWWKRGVRGYRHLLDCPWPHLFRNCHGMCENAQVGNSPECSCICEWQKSKGGA